MRKQGSRRRNLRMALLVVTSLTLLVEPLSPLAGAVALDGSEPVREEIVSKRAKNAKFFLEPDGTQTAEFYTEPIHYLAEDGSWEDVSTRLVPSSARGFTWQNEAGSVNIRFAAKAASSGMVEASTGSASVGFGLVGANPAPTAVVEGDRITYPDVLPGVDLVYEVRGTALKESLILKRPPVAPMAFPFSVSLTDLTVRQEPDGSVSLVGADGNPTFVIPRGWMEDSSEDPRSLEPAWSEDVTFSMERREDLLLLRVTPDLAWLQDPARVYPVTLDPSTTFYVQNDTYVQSSILNTPQNGETYLKTGTYDGGTTKARTLVKFTGLSSALGEKHILSADLNLYEYHAYSCSARQVHIRRLTEDWAATVTWPNQPAAGSTQLDEINVAKGYSGSCPDGWITFDATTPVRNWVDGTWSNYGLRVQASSETDSYGWKRFWSKEYNGGSHKPKLVVSFNSYPVAPSNLAPASGTVSTNPQPTLLGTYNDPDPGDSGSIGYEVRDSVGALKAAGNGNSVTPAGTSSWPVPAGALQAGQEYQWRARSEDGVDVSPWGPYHYYTVQAPPNITSVADSGPVVAGDPVTFQVGFADPEGNQVRALMCKTDAVSAGACAGGTWATTPYSATSPVSAVYQTASNDIGTHQYFAFTCDDVGACSESTAATLSVTAEPTPPGPPLEEPSLDAVSRLAEDEEVFYTPDPTPELAISRVSAGTTVRVYRDADDNEVLDPAVDVLLAEGQSLGSRITLVGGSLGSVEDGFTILTRATDSLGGHSPVATDVVVLDFTPQSDGAFAAAELDELKEVYGLPGTATEEDVIAAIQDEDEVLDMADEVDGYAAGQTDEFAGLYIDTVAGDTDLWVGFTANLVQHEQALQAIVSAPAELHLFAADFTLQELEQAEANLDHQALRADGVAIVSSGVDEMINRVEVGLDPATPEQQNAVYTYMTQSTPPSDPDMVVVVEEEQPVGFSRENDPPPFKAGLQITNPEPGGDPSCTSGFLASRDGDDADIGFFTAGHCFLFGTGYWKHAERQMGPVVFVRLVTGESIDGSVIDIASRERREKSRLIYADSSFSRRVTKVQPKEKIRRNQPVCVSWWRSAAQGGSSVKCTKVRKARDTVTSEVVPGTTVTLHNQIRLRWDTLPYPGPGSSGSPLYRPLAELTQELGNAMAVGILHGGSEDNLPVYFTHIDRLVEVSGWHVRS